MGEGVSVHRVTLLLFVEPKICLGALQALLKLLFLLGAETMGSGSLAIHPLPDTLLGGLIHFSSLLKIFYGKIEKMCEKALPFSVHLCYNEKKYKLRSG
jgi:hypothetical protein